MRMKLPAATRKTLVILSIVILSSFTILKYVFDRNDVIFSLRYDSLKQLHYSPNKLDDNFSEEVFDQYLNTDFHKKFLLQTDIDALSKYKHEIDDEIAGQRQDFYKATREIVDK